MNIILISSDVSKTINLSGRKLTLLLSAAILVTALFGFMLGSYLSTSENTRSPLLRLMPGAAARQSDIDALAIRLGELQAKLIRIDGLAKVVGEKTGIDVTPFLSREAAPQGGIAHEGKKLSAKQLKQLISEAEHTLSAYQDQLTLAESTLLIPNTGNLPIQAPITQDATTSSGFGERIDPINGSSSFHEGLDYLAPYGSPISAVADGIVSYAGYHPEYGNMVQISHGNDLTSRYAHSSKLNVRIGDKVKAGQVISYLGNTGRSTGPHLHFEIRYKNVPQNPLRFLAPEQVATSSSANKP